MTGDLGLAALGLGLCLIAQEVDQKERDIGLGPMGLDLPVDMGMDDLSGIRPEELVGIGNPESSEEEVDDARVSNPMLNPLEQDTIGVVNDGLYISGCTLKKQVPTREV